ncbi:MAG TPA: hypothetical protein VK652_11795 [Steroidobacteraceae bacterium]|nr:hypothetical protein [Steroidobacteraceae bacterium]
MDVTTVGTHLSCWIAAALLVLANISGAARADSLDQITVQAQRETLRKQVDQFFHSAMLKPLFDESPLRWEDAVCPTVEGMIRPAGEFVLRRLSELARESGVPLAKDNCKHPNLFIVVAKNPETFLKLWWRRQPRMYDTAHGIAPVRRFIEKSRPIRVWYNIGSGALSNEISGLLAASVDAGLGTIDYPIVRGPSTGASTLLIFPKVRRISTALVVIDPAQVAELSIGQFADYIAMVSFVEINQDADLGANSTILNLLAGPNAEVPLEMTRWDKALLRALYTSEHGNRMQMSQMETRAINILQSKPSP